MGAALPFDPSYRPKAAYDSMVAAFRTAPPVIAAAGLVNAASYAAEGVAPGEIVALFGATFGPAELTVGPSDVRLFFDGLAAPVLYARVGQAGAVVPFEVAGRTSTEVRYEYLGAVSNTVTVAVKAAVPGIFTLNSSGAGAGAILDGAFRVVSAENPARRGEAVAVYLTGAGATAPSSVDGQVYGGDAPRVAGKVGVTIDGIDCPVLYAGGAPGLIAGAVQINVQTPAVIAAGEHAIVVTVDGAASQPGVTIAVQ
jgi:uncharacterized protein (TIGR03437 family)